MAKLTSFPAADIISGFKGVVDFYVHDGVPCLRRWPRSPGKKRSPAVEAQWSPFTYASRQWSYLTEDIQYAYNKMASGTGLSGRDMFIRLYLTEPEEE